MLPEVEGLRALAIGLVLVPLLVAVSAVFFAAVERPFMREALR